MKDYLAPGFVVVILLGLAGFVMYGMVDEMDNEREHRAACLRAGYPEMIRSGKAYYCMKLEHGSQLVVRSPLENRHE